MSQSNQEGPKIISRQKKNFPWKMTKTLKKILKKFSKFSKKFFGLKVIKKVQKSFLDQKFFLKILKIFCEFFKVFCHFQWKKKNCLEMIFGPS